MRKAYPNEIFHSVSPIVYRGKNYDKTAENYLKNSGSAEEQRAISAIIDKVTDSATKSMLKQASSEALANWCSSRLKSSAGAGGTYGLTAAELSRLLAYARKGLTYGTRPTYAEPDYQRAKIDAENDRYNRTYNTARMQTNANRRRKLTMGGRKDKA